MEQAKCNNCGYEWEPLVDDPKQCPKCKTTGWNKIYPDLECSDCGHEWTSRKEGERPMSCPNCKSYSWNRP